MLFHMKKNWKGRLSNSQSVEDGEWRAGATVRQTDMDCRIDFWGENKEGCANVWLLIPYFWALVRDKDFLRWGRCGFSNSILAFIYFFAGPIFHKSNAFQKVSFLRNREVSILVREARADDYSECLGDRGQREFSSN